MRIILTSRLIVNYDPRMLFHPPFEVLLNITETRLSCQPGCCKSLPSLQISPKSWNSYVYNKETFCRILFDVTLNSIVPNIAFTIEPENNGQIPFLDTLVSRGNDVITINVYKKIYSHRPIFWQCCVDRFYSHHEPQANVVYKIPCADRPWSFIGKTGRC